MSERAYQEVEENLTEQELDDRENQILMLYGDVFFQLANHPRFNQFMELNYTVNLETNDETKSVRYNVREKSPAEVAEGMQALMLEIKAQEAPQLVTATGADVAKFGK